jgi:hypothetical protein
VQQRQPLLSSLDQQVVEADLAELVDHHRGLLHGRVAEQVAQHGGLAAAQEAGQHRDR